MALSVVSTEGRRPERRDLASTTRRLFVERRSLDFAPLRSGRRANRPYAIALPSYGGGLDFAEGLGAVELADVADVRDEAGGRAPLVQGDRRRLHHHAERRAV